MLEKEILYFREEARLVCDGKCNKAWGLDRPAMWVDPNEDPDEHPDNIVFLADDELPDAPVNPGDSEGGWYKPLQSGVEHMNKWCARACERSVIVKPGEAVILPDFSKRIYNIPRSDPNYEGGE